MIRVLGIPRRACDGVTRREALRVGGLSLLGMTLPDLLRAEATLPAGQTKGRARSVILLYLFGGPPLHDTFDPKPKAPVEIRGEFRSTPTTLPGVHVVEHLPRLAQWMHRSALIRSATHPHNDHSAGLLYTMSGKKADRLESLVPVLPSQAPSMNSVVNYLARDARHQLPASVWMPCYTGWGQSILRPGPYAGFLGRQFDPFFTNCQPQSDRPARYAYPETVKGTLRLPGMDLPTGITLDRLDARRTLLKQIDDQMRRFERSGQCASYDFYRQRAFDLLTSSHAPGSAWRAFQIDAESPALRQRYGLNLYGQSTLTARRLIEAGVRFVTVTWEVFEKQQIDLDAWDTHERNFPILKDHRLPVLDQAYSALCEDLDARGLLDETLIVVMGEMGRSPRVNKRGGRDHWSYCYNVLLTGAGIRQGTVFGSSDNLGAYPSSDAVGPEDIIATIYAAMGIDPSATIYDLDGRPHLIAQGGKPIRAVLS